MPLKLNLPTLLRRSLLHRRARSLSALVALTVSAAIVTALLTLYTDLDAKLHTEFRSFGANIVLTSTTPNAPLPPDALPRIQRIAGPQTLAAPFAFAVATTGRGTPIVVVGTDFPAVKRLDAWWKVDTWPTSAPPSPTPVPQAPLSRVPHVQGPQPAQMLTRTQVPPQGPESTTQPPTPLPEALLGAKAANFIADTHTVTLTYAGHPLTLHPVSLLRTGGDEDSRVYIPISAFVTWTGTNPTVIELQVSGDAATVNATIAHLHAALPNLKVEPVRQLVEGESRIVDRTHALMYAAVLLIALTVAVSVLATLSASVLERRRDFALMRALGSSHLQLIGLFLLESTALALAGVATGFVLGSGAAWLIGEINFGTATLPRLGVLPLVLLLNLLIASAAALLPARVLRRLEPAALLKGE